MKETNNNPTTQVKLEMMLDVDTKNNAENLKDLEHHIDHLLDLKSYPEIKSVYNVNVTVY